MVVQGTVYCGIFHFWVRIHCYEAGYTLKIEGLRYKLRMFGVPVDGQANILSDNQAVILNSTVPSSTLRHKHNAICYHRVREAVAAGIIRIAKVDTKQNLADMFKKPKENIINQKKPADPVKFSRED
jgi:hypothetical protein